MHSRNLHRLSNFTSIGGHGFLAELPSDIPEGDTNADPRRSRLDCIEDGVRIGPAHSPHADIIAEGRGRYSHWHNVLYFSTQDNSDPRINGREYYVYRAEDGNVTLKDHAAEVLKMLPESFSPAQAYAAVEKCLEILYPSARLGEDGKSFWYDSKIVDAYRALCGDNFRSLERKITVYHLTKSVLSVQGDLAECGAYNGSTAYFMALAGEEFDFPRELHLFDSFEGLSEPRQEDGTFWQRGALTSPEECARRNLAGFSGISFYRGWIPTRFSEVADRRFAFVHIDVDLYAPTRDSIEFFYPRLATGGILLCDDYGFNTCPGARKAMDDYFENKEHIVHLPTGQGFITKR